MMNLFKLILKVVGVAILLVVFVAVYALAMSFKQDSSIFSTEDKTIGALGGFHLLTDIDYEEHDEYWRIILKTSMNRVSPIEGIINTPQTKVTLKTIEEPVLFSDGSKVIPELGPYYLEVNLADTRIFDLEGDLAEPVFVGEERQLINQDNINEVRLHQPPDDSLLQVLVGVDEGVEYRLQKSSQDTGIVWLDVLK